MRMRIALLTCVALIATLVLGSFVGGAGAGQVSTLAQAQPGEGTGENPEQPEEADVGDQNAGEGQSDPDAETGASQGEREAGSNEEGPQWTYQMGRIGVLLVVLLLLAIAGMYMRLVVSRQRAGI